jgi:ferredoxin
MKKIIYYFSGTGNSLRAARIIAKKIGGARLINMRNNPLDVSASNADVIGFVCPVYEWDVPEPVKAFIDRLSVNPNAYIFMVATYIFVHGRCFETVNTALQKKGTKLHYGKGLRCVASQCLAYEPFPPARFMVPYSDKKAMKIGKDIAASKIRKFPKMSFLSKRLYSKMMIPFLNVQQEFDKGFYTSEKCVGCEICRKVCPCDNITFSENRPVWNHHCVGCNACVVYCPTKAILFQTPEAYAKLNNAISRKIGLPEKRTRYHNPHITAADLMKDEEEV